MKQIISSAKFVSSTFLLALIICLQAVEVKSEELSASIASEMLIGHWNGQGDDTESPYVFHTVNCRNGRFATAVIREEQATFIYFGSWETDGATITHDAERSGTFDPRSLEAISMTDEHFLNRYHLVELTEALMVYEWRGQTARRFEARRTHLNSGALHEGLNRIACHEQPFIS